MQFSKGQNMVSLKINNFFQDHPTLNSISRELAAFIIFFGFAYVPFYYFEDGTSFAPSFLKKIKYVVLIIIFLLTLLKISKKQFNLFNIAFSLLTIYLGFNYLIKGAVYSYTENYIERAFMPLISLAGLFILKTSDDYKKFINRFLQYAIFSCLVSILIFYVMPDHAWVKGDLVPGQASVSGLLDNSNRFSLILVICFWLSIFFKSPKWLAAQCIFILCLFLSGSFGALVLMLSTYVVYFVLKLIFRSRIRVLDFVAHATIFVISYYLYFTKSFIHENLVGFFTGQSVSALKSNSFTNRSQIPGLVHETLSSNKVTDFIFGSASNIRIDSFLSYTLINGGFISGVLLTFVIVMTLAKVFLMKTIDKSKKIFIFVISATIILNLIYEESFFNFPYWLTMALIMSFINNHELLDTDSESF